MNRKEIKEFLEMLHFHGYIDHDITKLENLINDYYPKQLQQADVSGALPLSGCLRKQKGGEECKYLCEGCFQIYKTESGNDR